MNIRYILSIVVMLVLVVNQFFSYSVFADEYIISGNGDGSQSSIAYQEDNSDTIQQSNNADINNDVDASANTGQNEANGNTGEEISIETGDASENIAIENSGNTSQAEIGCCESDPSSLVINGNGSDTYNDITYGQNNNTSITQNNKLKLANNIKINANTGENEADDNEGNIEITTGEVNILAQILNENLNSSYIKASKQNPQFNLKIAGNGSGSTNTIDDHYESEEIFTVLNELSLTNQFLNYSNTGKNKANKNSGKVFISTGNIYLDLILSNKVNTSKIIAQCCQKNTPSPTPSPSDSPSPSSTPSPSSPPSSGGGGGNGGSGGGSNSGNSSSGGGGGEVLGVTLPATGGNAFLLLTLGALLILAAGVILRTDYAYAQKSWKYFNYNFSAPTVIYLLTFYKTISFSPNIGLARGRPFYFYPTNSRFCSSN